MISQNETPKMSITIMKVNEAINNSFNAREIIRPKKRMIMAKMTIPVSENNSIAIKKESFFK